MYLNEMIFQKTACIGAYVLIQELREDERGYFVCLFSREEFLKQGIDFTAVRASQLYTKKKGTIRGMHFQRAPKEEQKIVWCSKGKIFDVVADLRRDSSSFGKWSGVELSAENHTMLYIPKGCAHGFQALEDDSVVEYLVSEIYSPNDEWGVRWNDSTFGIKWPLDVSCISQKDCEWQLLK